MIYEARSYDYTTKFVNKRESCRTVLDYTPCRTVLDYTSCRTVLGYTPCRTVLDDTPAPVDLF